MKGRERRRSFASPVHAVIIVSVAISLGLYVVVLPTAAALPATSYHPTSPPISSLPSPLLAIPLPAFPFSLSHPIPSLSRQMLFFCSLSLR
eukprot:m.124520 g.124520  ORF g.124520 m.124520 type:complete len:91 (+) comp15596_c0_seq6:907-1179(+)